MTLTNNTVKVAITQRKPVGVVILLLKMGFTLVPPSLEVVNENILKSIYIPVLLLFE